MCALQHHQRTAQHTNGSYNHDVDLVLEKLTNFEMQALQNLMKMTEDATSVLCLPRETMT